MLDFSAGFQYWIVYVVNGTICYNCFSMIMQKFGGQKCFCFKTPDGTAGLPVQHQASNKHFTYGVF